MTGGADRPLLVIGHVPWEGPHRIARAFGGVALRQLDALTGPEPLPAVTGGCAVD